MTQILQMISSEYKISPSIKSCNEKTAQNDRNWYIVEKHIASNLSKISMPNFESTYWRLKWRLCQNFRFLFLYFPKSKPSKSVTVEPVHRSKWFKGFRANWLLIVTSFASLSRTIQKDVNLLYNDICCSVGWALFQLLAFRVFVFAKLFDHTKALNEFS